MEFIKFVILREYAIRMHQYICTFFQGGYPDFMDTLIPETDEEVYNFIKLTESTNEEVLNFLDGNNNNLFLEFDETQILRYCEWSGRENDIFYFFSYRYGVHIQKFLEVIIFTLSKKRILPYLGRVRLTNELNVPPIDNLYEISGNIDKEYGLFFRRYIFKLFRLAGWDIRKLKKGSDSFKYEIRYLDDDFYGETVWCNSVMKFSEMEDIYIFVADESYSDKEICSIFSYFSEGSFFGIVNSYTVIVSDLHSFNSEHISLEHDGTHIFPGCALMAWYYKQNKQFVQPRLGGSND